MVIFPKSLFIIQLIFSLYFLGTYIQKDLNQPKTVPKRAKYHMDYLKDAPLTSLGQMQSFLTGIKFEPSFCENLSLGLQTRCVFGFSNGIIGVPI